LGISWGSFIILVIAIGVNASFMAGGTFWDSMVKSVKHWIMALSIPVEAWPPFLIIILLWSPCMYALGWYVCFVETGDDTEAEKAKPTFVGKNYRGNPVNDPVKMVLVVREDLGMTPGKVATQAGHASVGLFRRLHEKNAGITQAWQDSGWLKMIGQAANEEELLAYQKKAKGLGLPTYIVRDAALKVVDGYGVENGNRSMLSFIGPTSVLQEAMVGMGPYL